MAREIIIAEAGDGRVDDFRDLSRADRRPDRPGGRGLVIAEGAVAARRLVESRYPLRAVLGVRPRIDDLRDAIAEVDAPAYVTTAATMAEIVGFHLNRGVLAIADRALPPTLDGLAATSRVLAVLEGVGDHENLGALFRNAAALGVDGVVVGPRCSDPLYRRSVRVSMGHVLRVPFTTVTDLPATVAALRAAGFRVAALTPDDGAIPLRRFRDEAAGSALALLLGAEGEGLSPEALDAADDAVRIPMPAGVDSLNVATAGAIAFYELAAQPTES